MGNLMDIKQLNNAIEVSSVDLENDTNCLALGKLVADECVMLVR